MLAAAGAALAGPAAAQPPTASPAGSPTGSLERTDAFERGFATSFYVFDACGDALAGRAYRRALAERAAQCPFSEAARSRLARRDRLQQAKSQAAIQAMIERHEGLPVRLDGMSATCHEQRQSEAYQALRAKLDGYAQGRAPAAEVVTGACDAAEIGP